MIEYRIAGSPPASGAVWSRVLLQPLAPGALTHFSASVLAENARRAWVRYFDRLGFAPDLRPNVVRTLAGRPYLNLSLAAELDARQAGREPLALRINGADRLLAAWEKPGFMAAFKVGRSQKKIEEVLAALQTEMSRVTAQAQSWLQRVQTMRWSQAEILQIMEEVERVGTATLLPFVAARHNLFYAYGRLVALAAPAAPAQAVTLVNGVLAGIDGLVESNLAAAVAELSQLARQEPSVLAQLAQRSNDGVPPALPPGAFAQRWQAFLAEFGHRCLDEGELAVARWSEDPAALLALIAVAPGAQRSGQRPGDGSAALLAALDARQRKEAQSLIDLLRRLLPLQSQALHAYSYILAGTRQWALAAAHEAMSDKRLLAPGDVFCFELEEMKQMMTGEWNVSDRSDIHATAADRRAEHAAWRRRVPGDLLVGDQEALLTAPWPAAAGAATAAWLPLPACEAGAIAAAVQPDSGAAAWLAAAGGLAAAQGSPFDPAFVAAAAAGVPAVAGLGEAFLAQPAGQAVHLDGSAGTVTRG